MPTVKNRITDSVGNTPKQGFREEKLMEWWSRPRIRDWESHRKQRKSR